MSRGARENLLDAVTLLPNHLVRVRHSPQKPVPPVTADPAVIGVRARRVTRNWNVVRTRGRIGNRFALARLVRPKI